MVCELGFSDSLLFAVYGLVKSYGVVERDDEQPLEALLYLFLAFALTLRRVTFLELEL